MGIKYVDGVGERRKSHANWPRWKRMDVINGRRSTENESRVEWRGGDGRGRSTWMTQKRENETARWGEVEAAVDGISR